MAEKIVEMYERRKEEEGKRMETKNAEQIRQVISGLKEILQSSEWYTVKKIKFEKYGEIHVETSTGKCIGTIDSDGREAFLKTLEKEGYKFTNNSQSVPYGYEIMIL